MKLNVQIRVINPVRSGVSQSSGREWQSQDVVVAWNERHADGRDYENIQLVTLHGENVDRFAQMKPQPGMTISADIAFSTRQYNQRVYNDNSMHIKND